MERAVLHDTWAELLGYPADEAGGEAIQAIATALSQAVPASAPDLESLADLARSIGTESLQEVYTRTFDGTTTRALELGWHLFGESYSRGAFLVRMRQLLAECEVGEASELPDHLGCVLAILGRTREDVAAALVRGSVLPAMDKIVAGFDDPEDPYRRVLLALRRFLDLQHPAPLSAALEVHGS